MKFAVEAKGGSVREGDNSDEEEQSVGVAPMLNYIGAMGLSGAVHGAKEEVVGDRRKVVRLEVASS